MIETSLVHIYPLDDRDTFVGCGAIVEGGYIATCRHVWRDAGGDAADNGSVTIVFPRSFEEDGGAVACRADLEDLCDDAGARAPDLVVLRPAKLPNDVYQLPIARHERFEIGEAFAIAVLPSRDFRDEAIEGGVSQHVNGRGQRRFNRGSATEYWFERGSSGSPAFREGGQQLAGLVTHAELGKAPQTSPLREAFIVPGTTIWFFVARALARPVAQHENVSVDQFTDILALLGLENTPASEIPAKIKEAIAGMKARAAEPVSPSNAGEDIAATVEAARGLLHDLDRQGALAILKNKRTEAAEERKGAIEREIRLLEEQAAIERIGFDYDAAKATLREILDLDPDRVWRWIDLGDLWVTTGPLEAAAQAFRAAGEAAQRIENDGDLSVSYNRGGDVQLAQGDLAGALKSYSDGLAIRDRLAKCDPGNADWQFDLGISNERIGDVQLAQGNLAAALKSYEAKRDIISWLVKSDPGNALWQRDLAVSFAKLGAIYRQSGDATRALDALRQGHAIMSRLTRLSPDNAGWKGDLAWFDRQVGELAL